MRTVWRYGLAVIIVAAALVLTRWLQQYTDITPLFYAAIIVKYRDEKTDTAVRLEDYLR